MKNRAISISRSAFRCIPLACFLLLAAVCAIAQTGPQGTFVGTVKDSTGAVVPSAVVTVVNTGTQFVSEGVTNPEGSYYIPFLNPGTYRITVVAPGFKHWVREGFELRPGETPRFDATLEVGAASENVTVMGEATLLNTETSMVDTGLSQAWLLDTSNVQKRIVRDLYFIPGVVGSGTQGYHILGNIQRSIGYSFDGISAKWPGLGTFDQNDQVIQTTQDALQEVKVVTNGMSAEFGHAASGAMQLVSKSGTNQVHMTAEDRMIRTSMVQRSYFQQTAQQPFRYDELDATFSGPLEVPKLYNGKNKTFFLFGFADHIEDWFSETLAAVPTPAMLAGDFTFGGLGYPIYDPTTMHQVNGTWTSNPFPGNIIPQNRFDPAVVKFLASTPWEAQNQPGLITATGPSQNFLGSGEKPITRTRWDVKVDHQFTSAHKISARYSQAHHRAVANGANAAIAWNLLDVNRISQPTDLINGVLTDTYIVSPSKFNEIRLGYNRRANQNMAWGAGGDWATKLGIPGISNSTFPQLNVGYGVSYTSPSYYAGDEITLQDNFTWTTGKHTVKFGGEMVRSRYDSAGGVTPSGSFNFGGTSLPFTPNTGNGFASFLLGSVTSATFSQRFANWLPRWWMDSLYLQDDWKVAPGLTLNVGVRWSYETPFHTKYGQESEFDPNATDPLTGQNGAITHPKGYLYRSDWHNFQPRVGLAWNFARKLVFRTNFNLMTMDIGSPGGNSAQNFEEYQGTYNINQPTGDPRPQFYLSQGPGVAIAYPVASNGTFPYIGSSYSSRGATWLDPGLVSPYIMSWSGGLQYEFARNWMLEVRYEGSAGERLIGSWNINEIPTSITLGGNTALQNLVYTAQQNYKPYTNFGNINLVSNLNHSTYHGGSIRVEKRLANGFTLTAFDTYSKALDANDGEGGGGDTYYNRALSKGVAGYNRTQHFNAQATYALPVGRNYQSWMKSRVLNYVLGDWSVSFNQTLDTGLPFSVGFSNSPNKYLTPGNGIVPLTSVAAAMTPNWSVGPNRFPTTVPPQTPYLRFSSFAYPTAYTLGPLGRNTFVGPALDFMGFALKKTVVFRERYRATIRLDGHNLPFKHPNFTTPNSSWSTASPQNFGAMSNTEGAWSEYGYNQPTVQLGFRFEF